MAYLSEDEITGTVNINIHASDDGKIINSTKSGQIIYKDMKGTNSGLCTNCTKFRKYSIASTNFWIESNNNGLNDFTMCAWVYPVKYNDTDFALYSLDTEASAFAESNNGPFEGNNEIVHITSYGDHIVGKATFNSWRHYAITKKNNTVYFFKNGKMRYSMNPDSIHFNNGHFAFQNLNKNSNYNTDNNFYLDDFVFISGQCLWTSDYTVPKEPLIGDIGNTEILWDNLNIFEKKNIPHDDNADTINSNMFFKLY